MASTTEEMEIKAKNEKVIAFLREDLAKRKAEGQVDPARLDEAFTNVILFIQDQPKLGWYFSGNRVNHSRELGSNQMDEYEDILAGRPPRVRVLEPEVAKKRWGCC